MCLPPPAHGDSMQTSNTDTMSKPPIPKCDNMNKISEEMDAFRLTQMSVRRTTNEYLMLCVIGFGSIERRDALMRVISWALEPILLYSAFIKDISTLEFEAVIITKKQVSSTAVEDWLGLFNMGICCIQFDSYMQPDMVTCISRIHHMGKHWFGSFKARSSARVRRDFYKEHMKELKAKEHQRLLDITGLTLTPRNMLTLHDRVSGLQAHIARLTRVVREIREAAETPVVGYGEPLANLVLRLTDSDAPTRLADTIDARTNLTSAYRRPQASDTLPAQARIRDVPLPPPPPTVDLTSPPESPAYAPNTPQQNPAVRGIAFIARPEPTGNVTLYVLRE